MALYTDLQAYYRLSANVNDFWNSDNGTNSGISFGTHTGVVSGDYAAPDYFYVANSAYNFSFGTGDFTFSVWVNPDVVSYGPATAGTLLGTDHPNYELSIYQGDILFYLGAGNSQKTITGSAVATGSWQHVLITRTGGAVTIHINNATPTQTSTGSPGTANITSVGTPQFQSGQRVSSANNHYEGQMADLCMWKRALTAAEITAVYAAGAGNFDTLLPIDASLQAYYQCNDASDTMGNHPATFNTVGVGAGLGKFGDAWEFTAVASYVSLATPTPNSSNFTAMGWAYNLRPDSAYRTLFYNGIGGASGGMHFITESASTFAGVYSNSAFVSTGTALLAAGYTGWHHYAVVKSGSTFTLYVDGVALTPITPTWPGSFEIAQIGGDGYGEGFAERLDDVAIWTRQLTAAEVTQIYNAGVAGNPLASFIPADADLMGQFSSIVHSVAAADADLSGQFTSIVHSVAAQNADLSGQFVSIVHSSTVAPRADLEGQFTSIVHSVAAQNADLSGQFLTIVHSDVAAAGGGGGPAIQGEGLQGNVLQGWGTQGNI